MEPTKTPGPSAAFVDGGNGGNGGDPGTSGAGGTGGAAGTGGIGGTAGADGTSVYCNQGDDGLYYLFITD